MKHKHLTRIMTTALVTGLLFSNCSCAKNETTTSATETTAETTTEQTTTVESTTESTSETTTETTTEATTTTEETTTESSETETSATETSKKKKKSTETTAAPSEATTTTTAAPTETTAAPTTGSADISSISIPGDQSGTAKAAAQDAIAAYCSSHSATNANGETVGYEFNESLMTNQKSRSKAARDNAYTSNFHREVSGTFIPNGEAAASFGAFYCDEAHFSTDSWGINYSVSSDPSFAQGLVQNGSWHYYWCDHSGTTHVYSSMYDCAYALSVFLITEHTPQLVSESTVVYYGIGCSCKSSNVELYKKVGIELPQYDYYIYIGGDTPSGKDQHGY